VPDTVYEPGERDPVVVIAPPLVTSNAELGTVVTKDTGPELFAVEIVPGAKELDALLVVAPEVGEVCVMVSGVTVSV
jgi:hypothetical protein